MRAVVFALALVTSPMGAAVCEFVCADHAVAWSDAAPADDAVLEGHRHHAAMARPRPAGTSAGSTFRNRIEDCNPPLGLPAAIRSAVAGGAASLVAHVASRSSHFIIEVRGHAGGPHVWFSPPPPLLSTIPLRI